MNTDAKQLVMETVARIEGAYAPATIRAYKADFLLFIDYCESIGALAFPAHPATVANFISHLTQKHHSSTYIRRIVVAITTVHQLNYQAMSTRDPEVSLALRRMYRQLGRYSHQAHAINKTVLDQMLAATGESLIGLRDRALMLVAYDTMCRRGELITLRIEDLNIKQLTPTVTTATILLRRSKTDQNAHGRWLHLSCVTWQALDDWLKAADIKSGALFRGVKRGDKITPGICEGQVSRIYKRIARAAGLDENIAQHISGHSMRVGAAQDLLLSGASLPLIMARGRWSKTDTVMRYIEQVALPI